MSTRHATVRSRRKGLKLAVTATAGAEHVAFLRQHLLAAHALIDGAPRELSLALVDDARMAQLHRQFLNIAGPTDVLTFELDHDRAGKCVGGEVVVCVDEAVRRAGELAIEPRQELLLYAVHGLLHLSGWDDRTDADYQAMHQREDQILTELGIGKLFHREKRPGRSGRRN